MSDAEIEAVAVLAAVLAATGGAEFMTRRFLEVDDLDAPDWPG